MNVKISPLLPVDPTLATAADIGCYRLPDLICLGYWRSHPDPAHPEAAGYYGRCAELAKERADQAARGEYVSLYVSAADIARAGVSTKAEYLAREADRAEETARAQAALPWPGDHVNPHMTHEERERIAGILDSAPIVASYRGSSWDRLSPLPHENGSRERSAGGYVWPEGLSTYVRRYGLEIDPGVLAAIEADTRGQK